MQKLTIHLCLAACILSSSQAIANPYKIKAVAKDGPAYEGEFMTATRNKRESKLTESPLFSKNTVSVLVIPTIKYIKPGQKDPNVLEAETVDARNRLVCRPLSRVSGAMNDSFYSKFSAGDLKHFKHLTDHRKATIFEFEPDCFRDAAEIRFYADVQNADESYRYSMQNLSEKTKAEIIADFATNR